MKTLTKLSSFASAAFLAASANAMPPVVTTTDTFDTDLADTTTTLQSFDTVGGQFILTGVTVTVDFWAEVFIAADNDIIPTEENDGSGVLTYSASANFGVQSSDVPLFTSIVPLQTIADGKTLDIFTNEMVALTGHTGADDPLGLIPDPDTAAADDDDFFRTEMDGMLFAPEAIDNAFIGAYIGTGTFDIDLNLTATSTDSFTGGIPFGFFRRLDRGFGSITVDYSFIDTNVVPEPSTNAAIAIGVIASFALIRRRFKNKNSK